jgi:hypothetical protein
LTLRGELHVSLASVFLKTALKKQVQGLRLTPRSLEIRNPISSLMQMSISISAERGYLPPLTVPRLSR